MLEDGITEPSVYKGMDLVFEEFNKLLEENYINIEELTIS